MPQSSGDMGQEGQMGLAVGTHVQRTPATPEQLPHLARTEVTMAGQQTASERLCNDRNNSSYSLPNEKKLKMDRTGKCPASLQACPNQNENKHLLTVQNGMLSCRAQAAPPLAPNPGLFCRSLCLPWGCAHRKTGATSSCSGRSCATWWGSRTLSWGSVIQPLVLKTTPGKGWGEFQTGPTIRHHTLKSQDVIQVVGKVPH